jgi:hypothetical protein
MSAEFLKATTTCIVVCKLERNDGCTDKNILSLTINEDTEYMEKKASEQMAYFGLITNDSELQTGFVKTMFSCLTEISLQKINEVGH